MKRDDIISYHDIVHAEKATVQKGMNFDMGKGYSVFLMSVRKGAPYSDAIDEKTGTLIYEGHDAPHTHGGFDPKDVDQPLTTPGGSWTENGKFFRAATDHKSGLRKNPEFVKVYEKIARGSLPRSCPSCRGSASAPKRQPIFTSTSRTYKRA